MIVIISNERIIAILILVLEGISLQSGIYIDLIEILLYLRRSCLWVTPYYILKCFVDFLVVLRVILSICFRGITLNSFIYLRRFLFKLWQGLNLLKCQSQLSDHCGASLNVLSLLYQVFCYQVQDSLSADHYLRDQCCYYCFPE